MGPIIYKALCGSNAQGLTTPTSDEDWKYLVLPTPKDIMLHRHAAKGYKDESGNDIDAHDVRDLIPLLWKANPSYMEILFPARYEIPNISPKTCSWICSVIAKKIILFRDDIACMNLPYLWRSTMGTYRSHMSKLNLSEDGTYSYKNACHMLRDLLILKTFADNEFESFATCIYLDDDVRARLLEVKTGNVPYKELMGWNDELHSQVEPLEKQYLEKEPNVKLYNELCEDINEVVWECVRNMGYNRGD